MKYNDADQGHWCSQCYGNVPSDLESCIKLAKLHNGFCLEEEYINNFTKMMWKCEEGHEFLMTRAHVQQGQWCRKCSPKRRAKTNLEKIGVEHPMKCREIAQKCAQNSNNSFLVPYWLTGGGRVAVGSYEKAFLEWANDNYLLVEWQPGPFTMPDGHVYTPDAYLPDLDIYVEIKGYFRDQDSKDKWLWFHETYPNSQLWTKSVLRSLGILVK